MSTLYGLESFVLQLEEAGELVRIKEFVNPVLEITEIVDRLSKSDTRNKAVLFENTGTAFPLLINAFGTEKRICMALGVNNLDDIAKELKSIFNDLSSTGEHSWLQKLGTLQKLAKISSWIPKVINKKGRCQDIVDVNPDINILPILKCWPYDGGRFVTLPVIHTKDLTTNKRNVGMYRMQVFDHQTTGLHWHLHKVSAKHFHAYKQLGLRMPVAVSLGGDPVYTYCATAPLPENIDEYILAGFLKKKKVHLVNCITQPEIQVPEDADIVLEGYIDTTEDLVLEGPFGDHTGYYSLEDWYPKFKLTAITYKKGAIYPATIVGVPPQEDKWLGKATERIFLTPIQLTMMPEMEDMSMPAEGVFHNLVLFSIDKKFVGQASKCMNTLWGAGQMMLNKILVAFDKEVKLKGMNYLDVLQQTLHHFNPALDCTIIKGPLDVLDHSSVQKGFGGKLGIDLTRPLVEEGSERNTFYFPKAKHLTVKEVKRLHTKITAVHLSLLHDFSLPVIIISLSSTQAIKQLISKISSSKDLEGIKIIIFTDSNINITNYSLLSWVVLNHVDPSRDISIVTSSSKNKKSMMTSRMFVNGTSKNLDADFAREWPNPVCSDRETIQKIDSIWHLLGLGEIIPSPSLDILPLCINETSAYAKKLKNHKKKS